MFRIEVDFAFSDTIQNVLRTIRAHRGRIIDFEPEGPAGGNPSILLSFDTKEQALEFLHQHSPGDSEEFNISRIEVVN